MESILSFLMTGEGIGLIILLAAGAAASAFAARQRWQTQSLKMSGHDPEVLALLRPGWLAERLEYKVFQSALGAALGSAEGALRLGDSPAARSACARIAELRGLGDPATRLIRRVVDEALARGEIRSILVRLPSAVAQVVCIPGRFEHRKLFERLEPFASGWPAYAERLLAAVSEWCPDGLLSLILFFDPEARNGALAVAYESSGARLVPRDLVADAGRAAAAESPGPFELGLRSA
jgi:hypothetical protein